MKKIRVVRIAGGQNSTLSHWYVDDHFVCYLLEDKISEVKEAGLTCIPEGKYDLKLNALALMNLRYKTRFPAIHQGMLEIAGIPNFGGVFFHIGNYFKDTKGCPLTGHYWSVAGKDFQVHQSTFAYINSYQMMLDLLKKQKTVEVEVVNQLTQKGGFYGL
jgi:hypothetical protein